LRRRGVRPRAATDCIPRRRCAIYGKRHIDECRSRVGRGKSGYPKSVVRALFDRFAGASSEKAGSPWAFAIAVLVLAAWAISGPVFGFSDTWQLIINTGTTIVTFLMVFLLQHTQNKDSRALQVKLDTLIAATETASNRMIDIEDLDDDELERMRKRFQELAATSPRFGDEESEQRAIRGEQQAG
jgi:low affinity Fe/Cu permease